jgi:hypothetical protein
MNEACFAIPSIDFMDIGQAKCRIAHIHETFCVRHVRMILKKYFSKVTTIRKLVESRDTTKAVDIQDMR